MLTSLLPVLPFLRRRVQEFVPASRLSSPTARLTFSPRLLLSPPACFNVTMEDNFKTDAANSTFNEEFWEVQRGVYESAGGWSESTFFRLLLARPSRSLLTQLSRSLSLAVFWNWKTDAAATWSFYQSQKQGWIPADLAASSCVALALLSIDIGAFTSV